MTNAYKINRRDFLKGIAALAAASAVPGCGGKSSDSAPAPSPTFAEKFTSISGNIYNGTIPLLFGNDQTIAMKSGQRHKMELTYKPLEDIANLQYGFRVHDKDGNLEWSWYSQPTAHTAGQKVTSPFKEVPILNNVNAADGLYKIEGLVRNADTQAEAVILTAKGNATWGGQDVTSTYRVDEALDWLIRKYNKNPNGGIVAVTGNTALNDQNAADLIRTRILADAIARYGGQAEYKDASNNPIAPTLDKKVASDVSLGSYEGFALGLPADNARVSELHNSLVLPADKGHLKVYEHKNRKIMVAVSGNPDYTKTALAARAVDEHAAQQLFYNALKIGEDTGSLVIEQG